MLYVEPQQLNVLRLLYFSVSFIEWVSILGFSSVLSFVKWEKDLHHCIFLNICTNCSPFKQTPGLYHYVGKISKRKTALVGAAQWTQCRPVNQSVAHSIPSLGHMAGSRAWSPVGAV